MIIARMQEIDFPTNEEVIGQIGSVPKHYAPNPARRIAEHLARDHPGRFGRDLPRLEREIQNILDNPSRQHTVQHGPTAGSRFYHLHGRSVMVRPNGEGTMVEDPNGNSYNNWVALEP